MKQDGQFILFTRDEFKDWLFKTQFNRQIKLIQNHHTYLPDYNAFVGNNHIAMLLAMKNYHVLEAKMADIAQNLTTFPDGTVAVCRNFERDPAGIYGANQGAICIENIGNFDSDEMNAEQKKTILFVNAVLCMRFKLTPSTDTIVYHAWYNLSTGQRDNTNASDTINHKTCPGVKFFGGNSVESCKKNFIPNILILTKGLDAMSYEDALQLLHEKCGISIDYWKTRATIDPYFEALIVKIATAWRGYGLG